MKSIFTHDFAYLIGNFMADGSLYFSDRSYRFEFVDGSPYEAELKYCLRHLKRIKQILETFLNRNLPNIIKKGNKFVLRFRHKELANLFQSRLKISPGKKHKIIDIPNIYKNSLYEKDFWIGYLDGDGSIARKFRKISVESMSKKIIGSFASYLKENGILFSNYESKRLDDCSYVIVIRSVSFRDFAKKIGFNHPLKTKLLSEKLRNRDFYVNNKFNGNIEIDFIIDYLNFFDDSVFIVNGRRLLLKYNYDKFSRENIRVNELIKFLGEKGLKKEQISKEIIKFRFKKSKGSTNSVKLPLYLDKNLVRISKFIRIREGGIGFSKRYMESFDENFEEILKIAQKIFDIKPKFTCKNEPLFCSGVISDFFNKIIKRNYN